MSDLGPNAVQRLLEDKYFKLFSAQCHIESDVSAISQLAMHAGILHFHPCAYVFLHPIICIACVICLNQESSQIVEGVTLGAT